MFSFHRSLTVALCVFVAGCSSYMPQSLHQAATPPHRITDLRIDTARMPLAELRHHRFDPSDGLDMTEVGMLAVVNNPDLTLARDDAQIGRAQAFAAGLLPDPQISLAGDLANSGGPGSTHAFNLGLSYDVNALLTRSAVRSATHADQRKTDLNLLWQEWQLVAQGRLLFVKLNAAEKRMALLQQNRVWYSARYRRAADAAARGLATSQDVAPYLTALQDVEQQIGDLARQINQNRHDLNDLLGLAPETEVPLQAGPALPVLDEGAVKSALDKLAQRRPDLIALEWGYRAQDARYRGAILAQFPALNIGITRARDNSNLYSTGIGITLSLPIFNRNRGNIAIERTTRQKLHDEYQVRLNRSVGDIHRILDEQRINTAQLRALDGAVAALTQARRRAERASTAGNLDALTLASLQSALLARKIEQLNLQQAILEQQIALQTLTGGDVSVPAGQESVM